MTLLLRIPDYNLRKVIISAVLGFWESRPLESEIRRLKNPTSKERNFDFRSCSKEFQQHVVEQSKVVETLVQAMSLMNHDGKIRLSILSVLEKLSRHSELNSSSLVTANGAEYVALTVADADKNCLPIVIDILWNAMEHGPKDKVRV